MASTSQPIASLPWPDMAPTGLKDLTAEFATDAGSELLEHPESVVASVLEYWSANGGTRDQPAADA
eukprot:6342242-Alexandrium_andersonii.AAC.1